MGGGLWVGSLTLWLFNFILVCGTMKDLAFLYRGRSELFLKFMNSPCFPEVRVIAFIYLPPMNTFKHCLVSGPWSADTKHTPGSARNESTRTSINERLLEKELSKAKLNETVNLWRINGRNTYVMDVITWYSVLHCGEKNGLVIQGSLWSSTAYYALHWALLPTRSHDRFSFR